MSIEIAKRTVGDGHPCFITFEAGATHAGVDDALALVAMAADAGADAVKFQIFDPDRLVADKKQLFSYEMLADRASGRTEPVAEPLYDILVRRCLKPAEWKRVKAAADARNLAMFATVAFEEDVTFVGELGCDSIKISSADVNHNPLLRLAAKTGAVIQLDTGNATLGEIETAVDVIRAAGNEGIIIHQCPSGYPARLPSIHLRMIQTLKAMFAYPVAYSDHTPGWEMDVAAVALGANLVEKTITLDRTIRGPEHVFSLERDQCDSFIQTIRDVETAMGSARRVLSEAELEKRKLIRRSAFMRTAKRAGEAVHLADIEFRRPGTGLWPPQFEAVAGAPAARDLEVGAKLALSDLVLGGK